MIRTFALAVIAPFALAACATTSPAVGGAATGAAIGAVGGAIIGNNTGSGDARTGAIIGAVGGAVAGAAIACHRAGGCQHNPRNARHSELYYDQYSGRYWYEDYDTGATFWQNGEPRTAARRR